MLVECDESLLDSFHIVIRSTRGFSSLQETASHTFVRYLEVEDVLAWSNCLLKLFSLGNLPGVTVDQESLGSTKPLNHCLSQEIQDGSQRDKLARLHDGGQRLFARSKRQPPL